MVRLFVGLMISTLMLFSITPLLWGEDLGRQDELIEMMIQIVLENNPTLRSQGRLVRESEILPEPHPTFALSGINFNVGAAFWNPVTNSFNLIPNATLGMSFSLGDPARVLNSFNLKKEKEGAKQDYQQIKNSIISDLLSYVREILRLKSQRENLEKLKIYLEDYSDLSEKQVKAGVKETELDKLWDLKERIMGIEGELQDIKNQLNTIRLEAAMRLGGDAWEELLELFWQLDEQI